MQKLTGAKSRHLSCLREGNNMDGRRALSVAGGGTGEEQNKDNREVKAYIILGRRKRG